MDAMTIFQRCRSAAGDIRRLNQRIQQRREALTGASAPQLDPNGGSRTRTATDKTGKLLADIDALERQVEARKQARSVELAAACALLDALPELESQVLYGYYIGLESAAGMARRMKYQDSYIRKVRRSGEKKLCELSGAQVAAMLPAWYIKEYGGQKNG